jgi:uncharacterized protein (DUF302 family)
MKNLFHLMLVAAFALISTTASADELLIARSGQNFEEAMSTLQNSISQHGYKVARVQRVDVGLTAKGYKTDKYRVVFFGKPDEIAMLSRKFPELIPYLPLSIAIFAEEGNTLISAARPGLLAEFYPDPELKPIFARWEKDLVSIFDEVREAN